jgi:hypothetical protein
VGRNRPGCPADVTPVYRYGDECLVRQLESWAAATAVAAARWLLSPGRGSAAAAPGHPTYPRHLCVPYRRGAKEVSRHSNYLLRVARPGGASRSDRVGVSRAPRSSSAPWKRWTQPISSRQCRAVLGAEDELARFCVRHGTRRPARTRPRARYGRKRRLRCRGRRHARSDQEEEPRRRCRLDPRLVQSASVDVSLARCLLCLGGGSGRTLRGWSVARPWPRALGSEYVSGFGLRAEW